ncbi:hypothetical protein [uncultured Thomasclavelia sp.]|uniref:hypothetical protein n=1 Tax=uncultured Thomasclavelia sp. TaxID=3025759 RepID=UPI002638FEFF|nr:hypothetical protein [uncultured Thomasclavelia sp.]
MKKLLIIWFLVMMLIGLTGCGNRQVFDTTYTFNKALIRMPDDSVLEVEIESWKGYEDGEKLRIKSKDGTTYLVSSINCVLTN